MRLVIVFVLLLQTGLSHTACDNCRHGSCSHRKRCSNCNDGYFLYHSSCYTCHQGCAKCYRSDTCITCNTGYYLHQSVCRTCSRNCETCATSASACSTCKTGYYGAGCASCSEGCINQICHKTFGNCQYGCTAGYYGTKCDPCPKNCLICTSSTSCSLCSPGYFGSKCDRPCRNCKNNRCSIDGQCTDGCIYRHYQGNAGCDPCPSNCLVCSSSTSCTSCSPGYFDNKCDQSCRNCKNNRCPIYGQCIDGCNDRHYRGNAGCDPCTANCNTCQSSSLCDGCIPGYHGTICQQDCPLNCTACKSAHNCIRCQLGNYGQSCENQCSKTCRSGCNKDTGECTQCIDGYFKEGEQCKACSNGCFKCQQVDSCEACQGGYFLVQSPNHCVMCGHNCSVCNTKDSCTTCNEGHANVNGRCLSCQNCKNFTLCRSQNVCAGCLDGYLGKFCGDKCNGTCIRCDKATGECTGCTDNTFGPYCELKCSRNCLQLSDTNSSCWQHNGTCTAGCTSGFAGPDCSENTLASTSPNVAVIVGSVFGAILVCATCVILGILLFGKRSSNTCTKTRRDRLTASRDDLQGSYDVGDHPEYVNMSFSNTGNEAVIHEGNRPKQLAANQPVQKKPKRKQKTNTKEPPIDAEHVYEVASAPRDQAVDNTGVRGVKHTGVTDTAGGQAFWNENVYDVTSKGPGQGLQAVNKGIQAEGDTYSHISHVTRSGQHSRDDESTYDNVTRHNTQKGDVDDTYDVASGPKSRWDAYSFHVIPKHSTDEYSTIGSIK